MQTEAATARSADAKTTASAWLSLTKGTHATRPKNSANQSPAVVRSATASPTDSRATVSTRAPAPCSHPTYRKMSANADARTHDARGSSFAAATSWTMGTPGRRRTRRPAAAQLTATVAKSARSLRERASDGAAKQPTPKAACAIDMSADASFDDPLRMARLPTVSKTPMAIETPVRHVAKTFGDVATKTEAMPRPAASKAPPISACAPWAHSPTTSPARPPAKDETV
mmetsp:Transcript_3362/g.10314  ORF Transcript_3362/g.10314 Transcript_3362/m.10314 type:complete len:228 (-) Transcript_3362:71-754(-)